MGLYTDVWLSAETHSVEYLIVSSCLIHTIPHNNSLSQTNSKTNLHSGGGRRGKYGRSLAR